MLERLSLERAMRLASGHRITVVSRRVTRIREFELVQYAGYACDIESHVFRVRTCDGAVELLTDVELGLRGDVATARLAEPEDWFSTASQAAPTPLSLPPS